MSTAEFAAVADYLYGRKAHGPKYGIDRMRAFAPLLGNPERAVPCVHIAGTNGKGSVAAMLDAVLRQAGWRVGLYTSPHLVHVGERVQVNRRPLSDRQIVDYVGELRPIAEQMERADADLSPSFFEYMTAMAFLEFKRAACDIALIEVGLGGRLDATNIVVPEVSVITSIGLDHCEILGYELTQIAAEKAGIIKPGVPVVVGRMPREAEKVIRLTAAQIGAPVTSVAESYDAGGLALPRTNLEGDYQRWNAATVALVARRLSPRWRLNPSTIEAGLQTVAWPGRWQRVQVGARRVILDTSHNPEGAETLELNLRELVRQTGRPPIVLTGILGTARAKPLIETICRHAREVHIVEPNQPRACRFEELEALVPPAFAGRVVRNTVAAAFPDAAHCTLGGPDDTVVVTGSIYLIGEIMARLAPAQ